MSMTIKAFQALIETKYGKIFSSVIAKNNYGPSNWIAYKEGNHKQFEGITDEDMVTDYGISPEIILLKSVSISHEI